MAHNKGVSMEDHMSLEEIRSAGGIYYEIGRAVINALMKHKVKQPAAKAAWSGDLLDQFARVVKGTHEIVWKPEEKIARTATLDLDTRLKAINGISDQEILENVAGDLKLEVSVRRHAFSNLESDDTVARYAIKHEHSAATIYRVVEIRNPALLSNIAIAADTVEGVASIAMRNLAELDQSRLAYIACYHANVRRSKFAVEVMTDVKLLRKVMEDKETMSPVRDFVKQKLRRIIDEWDPMGGDPCPVDFPV